MSVIAGLQDFRQEGPPADIGTFQLPCSMLVFPYTFSGTTYICAIRSGVRGWVLVDYGTDASTVIQAAIDALTDGGVIFLKEAVYDISTAIKLTNSITILGETDSYGNVRGTILKLANGADDNILEGTGTIANIKISGISFHGNRANNTNGHAIYLENCDYTRIEDCHFHNIKDSAILVHTGCNVVWMNRLHMMGVEVAWGYGVITISGSDCFITNCAITNSKLGTNKYGIFISGENNHIIANDIFLCSGHGIYCYEGDYNTISLNRLNGNGGIGIAVYGSKNNVITGNRVLNNGSEGIRLWGTSTGNIINGNRCYDLQTPKTQTYGIRLDVNSDDNTVIGNNVLDNKDGGIINSGSNNIIKHNKGFVTENNVLSPAFAIDAVAVVTVTIPHGLDVTPAVEDCQLTVVEDTDVDDWAETINNYRR